MHEHGRHGCRWPFSPSHDACFPSPPEKKSDCSHSSGALGRQARLGSLTGHRPSYQSIHVRTTVQPHSPLPWQPGNLAALLSWCATVKRLGCCRASHTGAKTHVVADVSAQGTVRHAMLCHCVLRKRTTLWIMSHPISWHPIRHACQADLRKGVVWRIPSQADLPKTISHS